MTSARHHEILEEAWQPPVTFRDLCRDAEQISAQLAHIVSSDALLLPADHVEFLARRIARLNRAIHQSLPEDVI